MREEAERAARRWAASWRSSRPIPPALVAQQAEWREARAERQIALQELEAASADADTALATAEAALGAAEREVTAARTALDAAGEESHGLQVRLTEVAGTRRSIVERVEAEWRRPLDELVEQAPRSTWTSRRWRPRPRASSARSRPSARSTRSRSRSTRRK